MPWCDAIQRFTHDFDVDFPVPSKSYCQRRNEFMPSRNVCPMQTCSPRWGWIPLEDTWQLGWHQAAPSRLLEKSQQKSSMFAKICQGHRWCWPILESFPRHEPLMGKSLCQPSVATFLRGDGAPGGGIRGRSRRWFFDFFPVDPCDPVTITASLKRFYDVLHGVLTIVLCHYARNTRPLLPSGNQTWQWNHPFLIIYRWCSY